MAVLDRSQQTDAVLQKISEGRYIKYSAGDVKGILSILNYADDNQSLKKIFSAKTNLDPNVCFGPDKGSMYIVDQFRNEKGSQVTSLEISSGKIISSFQVQNLSLVTYNFLDSLNRGMASQSVNLMSDRDGRKLFVFSRNAAQKKAGGFPTDSIKVLSLIEKSIQNTIPLEGVLAQILGYSQSLERVAYVARKGAKAEPTSVYYADTKDGSIEKKLELPISAQPFLGSSFNEIFYMDKGSLYLASISDAAKLIFTDNSLGRLGVEESAKITFYPRPLRMKMSSNRVLYMLLAYDDPRIPDAGFLQSIDLSSKSIPKMAKLTRKISDFAVSNDGKRIFLCGPMAPQIEVLDASNFKPIASIDLVSTWPSEIYLQDN